VGALERFARDLPVREHVDVVRGERIGPIWRLEASDHTVVAANIIVASGFHNVPRRPDFASALPAYVRQLHAAEYRRADDVEGSILVVGGGQSGVQIADDLIDAGKRVYVATSRVGRMPRRHRGRDANEWLLDTGQFEFPVDEADSAMIEAAPPQISGVAGGRTISYQYLARRGATLLGRAVGYDNGRLELDPDVGSNIRFADERSRMFRASWDKHLTENGVALDGDTTRDPADETDERLHGVLGPSSLDLAATGIATVIWATGFRPSTGWLPEGALDAGHRPQLPGLHVVGAPWLTHRSSANLYGMAADAARLVRAIADARLDAVA
jgi:putative flavoprotein involved in K+ transport